MKKRKTFLFTVFGLGITILLGSFGISYTSNPSFCTNCHEVAPAVTAWEMSVHKSVDCLQCHAEPGLVGKIDRKLGAWKEVKAHLFDDLTYEDLETTVPAARCYSCHEQESLFEEKPFHDKYVNKENKTCASCHRDAIHVN